MAENPELSSSHVYNPVTPTYMSTNLGRINSTIKWRKEAASERLGKTKRQREAASNREGGRCAQGEGKRGPRTREFTRGRLIPITFGFKIQSG